MRFIAIPAILLFATFASAATQASDAAFIVTELQIRKVAMGNITLDFTVYDPDPLTNATDSCTGSWKAGTDDYPKGSYVRLSSKALE